MSSLDIPVIDVGHHGKKQRGRLKKLRRKSREEKQGCETSGITSFSDFCELQELEGNIPLAIGPAIRQRRATATLQLADGEDHRNILFQVLERTSVSKKMKRVKGQVHASIPPWATLHNSAMVKSLAIIEIQLVDNCDPASFLSQIPVLMKLQSHQVPNKLSLPVFTRWFQGPKPKSITDTLMYFQRSMEVESSTPRRRKYSGDLGTTEPSAVDLLQSITMTAYQRETEGYPIRKELRDVKYATSMVDRPPRVLPTLEDAKNMLRDFNVAVLAPSQNGHAQFVAASPNSAPPRAYALDCEMITTTRGSELARVTLVRIDKIQDNGVMFYSIVLDELVKPYNTVVDYLTIYSGITEEMLNPVQTRLEQIQAVIVQLLQEDDVIVGHSLENDLRALHLVHDRVVDTAVLFKGHDGRKYSLKHLTATLLKRSIQDNGGNGHCSAEDAVASLELALKRAQEGPNFRIYEAADSQVHLFECLNNEQDKPIVCVGPSEWLKTHVVPFASTAHALTCETVQDDNRKAVSAWLVSHRKRARLVWAKLITKNDQASIDAINEAIKDVIQRSLDGTLTLVAVQRGYDAAWQKTAERKARMNPRSSLGWTASEEETWQGLTEASRSGHALWIGT